MSKNKKCPKFYSLDDLQNSNGIYCYMCEYIHENKCLLGKKAIPLPNCTQKFATCVDCPFYVDRTCINVEVVGY